VGGGSSIEDPFLGGWLSHHVGEVLSEGGGSTVWVGPMLGDTEGGVVGGVVVGAIGGSVAGVGGAVRSHAVGEGMAGMVALCSHERGDPGEVRGCRDLQAVA
jgi:hypothetical protein